MKQLLSQRTIALCALAIVLLGQTATGNLPVPFANQGEQVAVAQSMSYSQQFTIPYTTCSGYQQTCNTKPSFNWSLAQQTNATLKYTVGPGHCSSVRIKVWVDGQDKGITEWMGWPGVGAQTSNAINLGTVNAGNHTIQIEAEGKTGGCNIGYLYSWNGTLDITGNTVASSSSSSVPSCIPFTGALRNISGLQQVKIGEMSQPVVAITNNFPTFTPLDSRMSSDIATEGPASNDFASPGSSEYYDFYYSNADGTLNANGSYITIDNWRYNNLSNAAVGNNIDGVELSFGNSQKVYAGLVASTRPGTGLSGEYINGKAENALGGFDNKVTYMGDQKSSFTVGFCQHDIPGGSSSSSSSSIISQCPVNLRHANVIVDSTTAVGGPASAVLGAPKGLLGSTNFDNNGSTPGFVKVGFPAPITNGPGADFYVHGEHQDEDFEVFVYSAQGQKASVGYISRAYPYNAYAGGTLPLFTIPFDISATGFSSVVAVEVVNRENRPSSDISEGVDLTGFTTVYCDQQSSSSSSSSSSAIPQCRDGIDNDGDGRVDYNNGLGDYGCDSPDDPTESPNPECSDGVDNGDPEDNLADQNDPGCYTNGYYDPRDPSESNGGGSSSSSSSSVPQCRDGIDNDGDGRVDYQNGNGDYGCDSNDDPTENPNPECSDGVDNGDPEDSVADSLDPGCHTDGDPNDGDNTYDPRDPSENNNGSSSSSSSINFDISVDDDEDEVEPEDDVTYVVEVTNKSNQSVSNVTVTVELDNDVNFDDCSNNCDDDDETITWTGLNFSANETKYLTIDAEVDEDAEDGDELETEARVFNERDTDDTDVETDDVKNDHDDDDADVEVIKDSSTSEVFPGGMVQYTVRIRNTGDVDLEDFTVTDNLPMGVQVIDDGNADRNSGGRLVWEIDRLTKGKTWSVSYRVSVPQWTAPGTILRNDVRVLDQETGVNVGTMAIVSVIGALPQTGGDVGGLFTMIISMVGAGVGMGMRYGRKMFV